MVIYVPRGTIDYMALEWVAPVVTGTVGASGVFFTWLTARQARDHLERMADRNRLVAVESKLHEERRSAYFSVLRVAEVDLRRTRYKRQGKLDKLEQVEAKWPKGDRVEMSQDAVILVELFGSSEARGLVATWRAAALAEDEDQMRAAYETFRHLARRELADGVLSA